MLEFAKPDLLRYYSRLEIVFIVALTTMMLLFGLIFAGNPNPTVFSSLRFGDFQLHPLGFAVFCIAFAIAAPFVLASPWVKMKSASWRQSAAVILTAPILLYLLLVFGTNFPNSLNASLVYYVSNYVLMMLAPLALYRGYQPSIERISTAALIIIHSLSALLMLVNPNLPVFERFNNDFGLHLMPWHHAALSVVCALGYGLLLAPLPNWSCRRRRICFLIFEIPIMMVSLLWLYNAWRTTGALNIPAAAFVNLSLLIGVLGFALCPTGRRRLIGLTGEPC